MRIARRRVVADRRLRIPEAAAAVQEARLGGDHRRGSSACRCSPVAQRERLAVRRLRLEPAGVGDRQRQLAVARQRRRQVDDQRVLVLDADAEQPAVLVADDRLHDQRSASRNVSVPSTAERHLQVHARAAVDPLPLRRRRDVDVVVEDVVVDEVVFVVERPALRQLRLRRVERDVVVALAVEQRDVLGLGRPTARRSACRSAASASRRESRPGRQQRPRIAAEIAEIDDERLRRLLAEDLLRALQLARDRPAPAAAPMAAKNVSKSAGLRRM